MTTKWKVIIAVVVVATAYATGYYEAPYKVKTEIKTVEVEKQTDKTQSDTVDHSRTTVTETRKPDGTVTKVTTVDKNVDTAVKSVDTSSVDITKDETKEVTKSSQPVTISFLAGATLSSGLGSAPIVYGGSVTKPVLGPVAIGLWGLSNATFGASLGLQF